MKFETKDVFVLTIHKSKSGKFVGCVAFDDEPSDELIEFAQNSFELPPVALDISITKTQLFKEKD